MGHCLSTSSVAAAASKPPVKKEGVCYATLYRGHVRPFDLVLFKGDETVSDLIRFLSKRQHDTKDPRYKMVSRKRKHYADAFSHAGLVISREVCDDPRLEHGKLYILESNLSGKLTDGVLNVDGKTYFGVQIRDFDEVIEKYNALSAETRVAVCHLNEHVDPLQRARRSDTEMLALRLRFNKILRRYDGRRYEFNPLSLGSAAFTCLRGRIRDESEKLLGSRDWFFCSELCAAVYRDLGVLPQRVDPRNVVPTDFLIDNDHEVDGIVEDPVYLT
jgi:hypothetical protein